MEMLWQRIEEDGGSGNQRAASGEWRALAGVVIGFLVWGALIFQPLPASAQSEDDAEYRLKLAFLYNFAQFVNWPPEAFHDSAAALTICVAGQDPFQGEIEQSLRGRMAGGHPIQLKRLKPNDDPRSCHIIFVRAGEKKLPGRILAAVKGSSALTVGETKGFADMGGVVNFTLEQNKLRFEINLAAAMQTQLKISSKLLALAKIVKAGP